MNHSTYSQFNLRSTQRWLCVLSVSASLTACGTLGGIFGTKTADDKIIPLKGTPEVLYKEAKDELDSSGWTRAIEGMDKVQAADALGVYGQQALLDTAYAHWRNGDSATALATIERYLRQFPKNAGVPYALYLKGIINFNERSGLLSVFSKEDLSERDPKSLQESYTAFERLVKDYPDSKYAKEAGERLTYIVNTLAKHEVGIALFYLQHGAPIAAVNRAQDMLKQYTQTPAQEEALGIMAESYRQLNLLDLRDNTLRVLQKNYPNSRHLAGGNIYAVPPSSWFKLW